MNENVSNPSVETHYIDPPFGWVVVPWWSCGAHNDEGFIRREDCPDHDGKPYPSPPEGPWPRNEA